MWVLRSAIGEEEEEGSRKKREEREGGLPQRYRRHANHAGRELLLSAFFPARGLVERLNLGSGNVTTCPQLCLCPTPCSKRDFLCYLNHALLRFQEIPRTHRHVISPRVFGSVITAVVTLNDDPSNLPPEMWIFWG